MKALTLIDKAFLLKKSHLFSSLDLDLLLTIADKMDLVQLKEKEKVFQLNANAHRLYLIVEGRVHIQGKEQTSLGHIKNGEFFGDESMFNDHPRAYEAICETPVMLLALSRSHLLSIISECPSVALAFLAAYTTQLEFRKR